MNEYQTKYKYDEYAKALKEVLDHVHKDYWTQYVDINRHQVFVARTYLWVSAALIGGLLAVYREVAIQNTDPANLPMGAFVLAVILGLLSFGISLYALPARRGYKRIPNSSWGEFSKKAYDLLSEGSTEIHPTILSDMIDKYDTGTQKNLQTNVNRAILLRGTSWILIACFIVGIGSSFVLIAQSYQTQNIEENTMTNESENTQPQSSEDTPQSSEPEKPNVPVPQGPIGTTGSNHHTHSQDRPEGSRVLTEDIDKE